MQRRTFSTGQSAFALLVCALALLCAVAAVLLVRRTIELQKPAPVGHVHRPLPPSTASVQTRPGGPTLAQALEPVLTAAARPAAAHYRSSAKDVLLPFSEILEGDEVIPLPPGQAVLEIVLLVTVEFEDDQVQVVHVAQAHEVHSGPEPDGEPEARLVFTDEKLVQHAVEADICEIVPLLLPALEETTVSYPGARAGERRTLAHTLRLLIPDLKPRR